jgi:hypothetical protein
MLQFEDELSHHFSSAHQTVSVIPENTCIFSNVAVMMSHLMSCHTVVFDHVDVFGSFRIGFDFLSELQAEKLQNYNFEQM